MKKLLSIIIWFLCALLTMLLFFVMLFLRIVLAPFDKQAKIVHAQCFWWSDAILALNPFWQMKVTGLENIDPKKTYVITANHQSLGDIIVIYQSRMQFKWVAKESLFKVPFIGWNLSLAKHIKLARGKFGSVKETYRQASGWLRSGMSVLFFPEGTRSKTGVLNQFKNGAFKLAIKEKKPILPISISGTKDAIAKGSWFFSEKASCELKILPEIDTSGFETADFPRLKEIVYNKLSGESSEFASAQ